jgi:hypothetical protein
MNRIHSKLAAMKTAAEFMKSIMVGMVPPLGGARQSAANVTAQLAGVALSISFDSHGVAPELSFGLVFGELHQFNLVGLGMTSSGPTHL